MINYSIDENVLTNLNLMKCESYVLIYETQSGIQVKDTTKNADDYCFNVFNMILQDQFNSQNKNAKQIVQSLKDKVRHSNYHSKKEQRKYSYQTSRLITYTSSINNIEGFKVEATLRRIISNIKNDNHILQYLLFINVNGNIVSLTSSQNKDDNLIFDYLIKGCTKFNLQVNHLLELCEQTMQNLGSSVITIYQGNRSASGNNYLLAKLPMKNYFGSDKSISSLSLQIEIEKKFKQVLRKYNSPWMWSFLTDGNTGYILLPKVERNYNQVTHNLFRTTELCSNLANTEISSFLSSLNDQIRICRESNYFRYVKPDTTLMNVNGYIPSAMAKFRKVSSSTFDKFSKNNLNWIVFIQNKDKINAFTNLEGTNEICKIFGDSLIASLPWNPNMRSLFLDWPQTYKKLSLK